VAELGGGFAVAGDAEGAKVVEGALASALGDGEDVVGVPERAAAGDGLHSVERKAGDAGLAAGAFERGKDGDGIGAAELADSAVAGEDLVAEVARVGAEAMLVNAVVGAEGAAAFGENFIVAPAAEGAAVFAVGQEVRADATAREGAGDHDFMRIGGLGARRK
jgi:hypothetical protein